MTIPNRSPLYFDHMCKQCVEKYQSAGVKAVIDSRCRPSYQRPNLMGPVANPHLMCETCEKRYQKERYILGGQLILCPHYKGETMDKLCKHEKKLRWVVSINMQNSPVCLAYGYANQDEADDMIELVQSKMEEAKRWFRPLRSWKMYGDGHATVMYPLDIASISKETFKQYTRRMGPWTCTPCSLPKDKQ